MTQPDEIRGLCVTLLVAGEQALVVLMDESGSVNRSGSGSTNNSDLDLYIGRTDPACFTFLRSRISPQLLNWCGQSRTAPDIQGKPCKLTIDFFTNLSERGRSFSMEWNYGSESEGPPADVCEFVRSAVEVTRDWHEQQKKMVMKAEARPSKPWWQFWRR